MRKYICSPFGEEVDLDDENTYSHLPNTVKELDDLMFKEIGFALCYMDYYHPDWFNGKRDNGQKEKVKNLIKEFLNNRIDNYYNVKWFREQIFIFQDQIENMC